MKIGQMWFVAIASIMAIVFQMRSAQAADFKIGFTWGNLKKCTSGNPNRVKNPKFTLSGVPKGTTTIKFAMKDLAVPSYNHGGGKVKYAGGSSIAPGAFKYKSPCPPGGRHTYQWTAIALDAKGKKLATVLAGHRLGIKEVDDGIWLISFMHYDLGYIDLEQRTLQTIDNPFGTRVSPMS